MFEDILGEVKEEEKPKKEVLTDFIVKHTDITILDNLGNPVPKVSLTVEKLKAAKAMLDNVEWNCPYTIWDGTPVGK